MAGAIIEIKYFNTFILRKTVTSADQPVWNGSFGIPTSDGGYPVYLDAETDEPFRNWFIEESRIRGGYNNLTVDFGVRAYLAEDEPNAVRRGNSLIYSGIFNSRTGINNSNVFSIGKDITKSADPANGSIQKLYAEDTNLIIFQERKVSRALIDKDAIYSAEGGGSITSSNLTIGVIQPYAGRWGISTNPESFATYGYRKYFSDKNNNVILRLSRDGITEISNYGMKDYFRDELNSIDSLSTEGIVRGGYDIYNGQYVVSTQSPASPPNTYTVTGEYVEGVANTMLISNPTGTIEVGMAVTSLSLPDPPGWVVTAVDSGGTSITVSPALPLVRPFGEVLTFSYTTQLASYETVSFDESINGWTSFHSYSPDQLFHVRNKTYTISRTLSDNSGSLIKLKTGYGIWEHHSPAVNRGNYYGRDNVSSVTLVFNPEPTRSKTFKTIGYEGSNGWELSALASDGTGTDYDIVVSNWVNTQDTVNKIYSYVGGEYIINPADGLAVKREDYISVFGTSIPPYSRLHAGFNRKENAYVANLINNSPAAEGEVLFGSAMSGIKGFYATATFRTDATTDFGGEKQLFLAASNYNSNNGF